MEKIYLIKDGKLTSECKVSGETLFDDFIKELWEKHGDVEIWGDWYDFTYPSLHQRDYRGNLIVPAEDVFLKSNIVDDAQDYGWFCDEEYSFGSSNWTEYSEYMEQYGWLHDDHKLSDFEEIVFEYADDKLSKVNCKYFREWEMGYRVDEEEE